MRYRLPLDAYAVPGSAWLITIGAWDRASRPFANPRVGGAVMAALVGRCSQLAQPLLAYCLMPDHLHVVTYVVDGSLIDLVSDLKSQTTRAWWQTGGQGMLWQRSFHDHGLRTAGDMEAAVRYVVENPVRAGLFEDWTAYPFSGGDEVSKG